MTNEVFDLELHEEYYLDPWNIMRVPGGWIYSHTGYNKQYTSDRHNPEEIMDTHSIFVPYSDAVKRELLEGVVNG